MYDRSLGDSPCGCGFVFSVQSFPMKNKARSRVSETLEGENDLRSQQSNTSLFHGSWGEGFLDSTPSPGMRSRGQEKEKWGFWGLVCGMELKD